MIMNLNELNLAQNTIKRLNRNRKDYQALLEGIQECNNRNDGQGLVDLLQVTFKDTSFDDTARAIILNEIIIKIGIPYSQLIDRLNKNTFGNINNPVIEKIYSGLYQHLSHYNGEAHLVLAFQNQRLNIHNSPHYIIALPKSASSMLGNCVATMISKYHGTLEKDGALGRRGYPSWSKVGNAWDWQLRPEIAADTLFKIYPGGIYKGHLEVNGNNLAILKEYKHSKYIILFRHPMDQLIGQFCNALKNKEGCMYDSILPFDGNTMNAFDVDGSIKFLIENGYLLHALQYIGKWLHFRDKHNSIVITYEAFMRTPINCLQRCSKLLELDFEETDLIPVHDKFNKLAKNKDTNLDRTIYPKGWSGEIGIWKNYFSEENTALFKSMYKKILEVSPWANEILEYYPLE
jgi:hypothetical protein